MHIRTHIAAVASLKTNRTALQTMTLFTAQIFSMGAALLVTLLLAKKMGPHEFGLYSFSLAVLGFVSIFFEFGYFASASRLLAQNHDVRKERELLAAAVTITLFIALGFDGSIFGLSFVIDYLFKDKIGDILRTSSIISFAFILPFFMDQLLKGGNHIKYLAYYQIVWKICLFGTLLVMYAANALTPVNALLAYCGSMMLSILYFVTRLDPSTGNMRRSLREIQDENRRYGFKVYMGRIISTGSFQLDRLLISYFCGVRDVGYYSLASSMCNPINTFSNALSVSKFKEFCGYVPISRRVLTANIILTGLVSIGVAFLGYVLFFYFLGSGYREAFPLLLILSVAVAMQSLYQPYNQWMGSNGLGRELFLISAGFACLSVAGYLLLVPLLGAIGATLSALVSNSYCLVHSRFVYRKTLKNHRL